MRFCFHIHGPLTSFKAVLFIIIYVYKYKHISHYILIDVSFIVCHYEAFSQCEYLILSHAYSHRECFRGRISVTSVIGGTSRKFPTACGQSVKRVKTCIMSKCSERSKCLPSQNVRWEKKCPKQSNSSARQNVQRVKMWIRLFIRKRKRLREIAEISLFETVFAC